MPTAFEGAAAEARRRERAHAPPPCRPTAPCAGNPSNRYWSRHPLVDSGYNVRKLEAQLLSGRARTRFAHPEPFRRISANLLGRALSEGGVDLLLLDLRDPDAFAACRVSGAHSYPAWRLYRSVNEFDATIVRYRNRQDCGRAIVLYDDDERLAARAGLLFCDKGVDNVFVLTGGLREFGARCPDLIDGDGFHRNEEDEELGGAAVRPPAPPGGFVDPRAPPAVSRARAAALARAARERPPGGAAAAAPPPPQPWQQPPRGRLAAEPSWIPTARWR